MNLTRLILVIFLFISFLSKSQSWCAPGAMWHYEVYNQGVSAGYVQLTYLNDTIISSFNCNKIERYTTGVNYTSGPYSATFGYSYTYTQNHVVFIKDTAISPVKFDTLFNFDAAIGSSWRLTPSSSGPCSQSLITVQDSGSKMIQGINLKWFKILITAKWGAFPYNTIAYNDTIIERIGGLYQYYYQGTMCPGAADIGEGGALRCYSDNQILNYKHNYSNSCNYIMGIDNFNRQREISIFPNPTNVILNIVSKFQNLELRITDVLGNEIVKKPFLYKTTIDVANWIDGIYFVIIKSTEGLSIRKIVVQH